MYVNFYRMILLILKIKKAQISRQSIVQFGKSKIVDNSNKRIMVLERFWQNVKKTEIYQFSEKTIRIGKDSKSDVNGIKN